ncbi:MAG: YhbY family RNA-binding protein [Bacteroides sp.]|nr:YhbY family RNA-binding protein [Eubacterium sp.]MCM1418571.1 YhbY family RNA-binding protein [Roseburia sp.]MCM1462626.1 YhbY family RNA-binding protein [Bacteroides sp.]
MTGKERAKLRSIANTYETVLFVGKNGIGSELIKQADDAIEKRELIKGKVHETCEMNAREVCAALCEALNAEPIQVIGSRFVIYRRNPDPKKRTVAVDE